jgi:hypothetical protein
MLRYRASDADEPSKADEQQPINVLAISSGVASSTPPPSTRADLMACSYNDGRHSAQWVLQYLENLKDAEADGEGNRSSFHCFTLLVLLLTSFFLLI